MNETPTPRIDNAFRNPSRKSPSMNATLDSVYLEGRKLEQELTAERALADRLAGIIQKDRDGHGGMVTDDKCNCEDCEHLRPIDDALVAWKEARNV